MVAARTAKRKSHRDVTAPRRRRQQGGAAVDGPIGVSREHERTRRANGGDTCRTHSRILRIAALAAAVAMMLPASATSASAREATSDLTAGLPTAGPTDGIPVLIASPGTLRFPGRPVGTTSPSRTITLTNSTALPATVASVTLSGDDPAAFGIAAETCTSAPVAPSGTCTVDVTFTPSALGDHSAVVLALDATAAGLGGAPVAGIGQAVSHVAWGTAYGAGYART